jgi:hypothetical protein
MSLENPFNRLVLGDFMKSLLPDFVLGFAFFTALAYAVLGRRFNHQRPAVAMSAALGIALSVGMVWWEERAGLSIRNLGPLAVGFAIIILAAVMYQAIHQVGGTWSGVGIALGASLLISQILNLRWPVGQEIVQTITVVALVTGILAFLMHHRAHAMATFPRLVEAPAIRRNTRDLQEGHIVSDLLGKRMQNVERQVDHLHQHPEDAGDAMLQIRRMLPAEGWLTQRLARLRENAYHARLGHVARIETIQHLIKNLPPEAKRKAGEELAATYKELGLDLRLDRLDKTVAANEQRIRSLTQEAQGYLAANNYRSLHGALEAAVKLQKHNSRLFRLIDRTEARLAAVAKRVARNHTEVTGG